LNFVSGLRLSLLCVRWFAGKLESRNANQLHWSPRGGYCLLAGLGQLNGALEFIDATTLESLNVTEHYMCTSVEWDASGRYVITAVTQPMQNDGRWKFSVRSTLPLPLLPGLPTWVSVMITLPPQSYSNDESATLF
jgi:hypothetical protein